jgi:hypothetical protein
MLALPDADDKLLSKSNRRASDRGCSSSDLAEVSKRNVADAYTERKECEIVLFRARHATRRRVESRNPTNDN